MILNEVSPLFTRRYHALKAYGGSVGFASHIFDIDIRWKPSRSGRFTPKIKSRSTHWIGDWVGLRHGLYTSSRE